MKIITEERLRELIDSNFCRVDSFAKLQARATMIDNDGWEG